MKKITFLSQLAAAGITAGLVAVSAQASDAPAAKSGKKDKDAAMASKKGAAAPAMATSQHDCKGHNDCKGQGGCKVDGKHDCKGHNECKGQGGCKMTTASMKADSAAAPAKGAAAATAAVSKHDCKGHNDCKGQGGCAMTEKDLKVAGKKMGMAMDKVGAAHGCKGHNECKGLGGCKM